MSDLENNEKTMDQENDQATNSGNSKVNETKYPKEKKNKMDLSENLKEELEQQKWRARAKENARQVEEAKKLAEEAAKKAYEVQEKANKRLINAELKVVAAKYGLKNIETAKLADFSNVSISEEGEVSGVEEAIQSLKEKMGFLFEAPSTAKYIEKPEPFNQTPMAQKDKLAFKLSRDEWMEMEQKIINNQF